MKKQKQVPEAQDEIQETNETVNPMPDSPDTVETTDEQPAIVDDSTGAESEHVHDQSGEENISEDEETPSQESEPEEGDDTPEQPQASVSSDPGPTPAEVSKALKKQSEEQLAFYKEQEDKLAKIKAKSIHYRHIPAGFPVPSTEVAFQELAKEAGLHMLLDGKWAIVEHALDGGITVQAVVPVK